MPKDVIHSGVAITLISDRVVDILTSHGFTGWTTYPVDLRGKHGESIPGCQGLAVRGRCGALDDSRSTKYDQTFPGGVFPCWRGYFFPESSWAAPTSSCPKIAR